MNRKYPLNPVLMIVLAMTASILAGCASSASTPIVADPVNEERMELAAFPDADGDSVPDSRDSCEYTARNVLIDSTGCELSTGPIPGLNFDGNETTLKPESRAILDRYVDALKRYPDLVVSFEGHTDNRGTASSNKELSKERVLSVARFITDRGISADRIQLFGYGESRPLLANATAEGRSKNRRIEIRIIEGQL